MSAAIRLGSAFARFDVTGWTAKFHTHRECCLLCAECILPYYYGMVHT